MALLWSLVVIDPLIVLSTILCGCVSIVSTPLISGTVIRLVPPSPSLLASRESASKWKVSEKIDASGKNVFCSNHLSYMDTPVVLGHIPLTQFRFLAKKGLFDIPFMERTCGRRAISRCRLTIRARPSEP